MEIWVIKMVITNQGGASTSELSDIASAIAAEMNQSGINARVMPKRHLIFREIGVTGYPPSRGKIIVYVVTQGLRGVRVKGPSPHSSNGKTTVDALIENIAETLGLYGLHRYDEKAGMYMR